MPPRKPILPVLLVIAAIAPIRYAPSCSSNSRQRTFGASTSASTIAKCFCGKLRRDFFDRLLLRETDADDQIEIPLRKRAQQRLKGVVVRGLDVFEKNPQLLFGFHVRPGTPRR